MGLGLFVALVFAVPLLLGIAIARWWAVGAVAVLGALMLGWIVVTDQDTSEDSTAGLFVLNAVLVVVPAVLGALAGVLIGRAVRGHRPRRAPRAW